MPRVRRETVPRNRDVAPSTMLRHLRYNFSTLCSWGATDSGPALPPYSHQNLVLAVQCCGAADVVKSLIDSILEHTALAHNGIDDIALDLATSIICACERTASGCGTSRLNLPKALRLERKNAVKLIATDPQRAEILVHLHRSVEAQLASSEQVATLQRGMSPIMDQEQLPGTTGSTTQDEPMLDFVDHAHGFDANMDLGFDTQTMFEHSASQLLGPTQGPIDFSHTSQHEQLQQEQQGDLDLQAQQQQVDDLFSNVDASSNSFFNQQNLLDGSFFGSNEEQQQVQQQTQEAQQQLPAVSGLDGARDQIVPMNDDDFWASLGVNNDY